MQGATYLKTLALVAALAVIGCKSATTDVTNIPGHKLADNGGNGNTGGGNGNTGLGPGGTGGETGGPGITPNPNPGFTPLGLPGEHEIVRDAFQIARSCVRKIYRTSPRWLSTWFKTHNIYWKWKATATSAVRRITTYH